MDISLLHLFHHILEDDAFNTSHMHEKMWYLSFSIDIWKRFWWQNLWRPSQMKKVQFFWRFSLNVDRWLSKILFRVKILIRYH